LNGFTSSFILQKKILFVIIYLSQIEIDLKNITMSIYEDTLFNILGIPRLVVILILQIGECIYVCVWLNIWLLVDNRPKWK
jgi:hypothetical protein